MNINSIQNIKFTITKIPIKKYIYILIYRLTVLQTSGLTIDYFFLIHKTSDVEPYYLDADPDPVDRYGSWRPKLCGYDRIHITAKNFGSE